MKLHPIALLHKFSAGLLLVLKPLGVWGVGAPGTDGFRAHSHTRWFRRRLVIVGYVAGQPIRPSCSYCLSGRIWQPRSGSLVHPSTIGRAGGELFLLKRINRERYERLRDRFERQEFLAILIPSLGPPPTPLKVFQFAAGVFEMKPLPFVLATFLRQVRSQFMANMVAGYSSGLVPPFRIPAKRCHPTII